MVYSVRVSMPGQLDRANSSLPAASVSSTQFVQVMRTINTVTPIRPERDRTEELYEGVVGFDLEVVTPGFIRFYDPATRA